MAIALRLSLVTLVLTGVVYPLVMTGLAIVLFPEQARGSLVRDPSGMVIGSSLIGQRFESDRYFHPRPSAGGYDGLSSGPSNQAPTSAALRSVVQQRVDHVRLLESLGASEPVPADLVCASASGLDPHISPEAARLQASRVAVARGLPLHQVMDLVDAHVERPTFGFIGAYRVNVLALNLALDAACADR